MLGAVQESATCPSPATAFRAVGAPGGPGPDGAPSIVTLKR